MRSQCLVSADESCIADRSQNRQRRRPLWGHNGWCDQEVPQARAKRHAVHIFHARRRQALLVHAYLMMQASSPLKFPNADAQAKKH